MELLRILQELWRRRLWLAPGVLIAVAVALMVMYRVSLFPPSLEKRTFEYATASTQLFVDSSESSLADIRRDVGPLTIRADLYSRFMTSPAFIELIARKAKLGNVRIAAEGPVNPQGSTSSEGSSPERRSSQIADEGPAYRLRFEPETAVPIVSVLAQAPTAREAERLANGAASALRSYLADIQAQQHVSKYGLAEIKQLGPAEGRPVVSGGTNRALGIMAFLGAFGGWCALVIVVSGAARQRQPEQDALGDWDGWAGGPKLDPESSNGAVTDDLPAGVNR